MSAYKIKQTYNIETASKTRADLMTDIYLAELSEGFSVVSSAATSRKLIIGSDVSEILSFPVSHELRKYLFSYETMPIVIPTLVGSALILPQVFASSRLFGIVFFKREKPDALMRVASAERFNKRVSVLGECETGKIRKWDEPLAERLDAVLSLADNIFDASLITSIDTREDILQKSRLLFDNIFELVGVEAELEVSEDIVCDEDFDAKLFSAFCLSMLMLCGKFSCEAVAKIRIFQKKFGISVEITFDSTRRLARILNPDIARFNTISDLNNMIFESSFDGGKYKVVFTPVRKDWSLLELKTSNEFTI